MRYTFDTEGVMRPLERDDAPIGGNATLEELQKLMRMSVPFAKRPRKKGIRLWSIGSEYKQLPKPGSAYIGGDGALSMILIFDEGSEVAFSSVKGDIDSVRYVRYHSFGLESGALLAMAYTTEHPAHFFILLATDLEKLASGNITGYDRSTLCLWDEVGSGTSMSARPPTARLRPRALHLPRILPRRELPDTQTYKPHEWLFGKGRGGDEYYIAPIRLSSARYEVSPFDTQESPNMRSELIPWPYYGNATYDSPPGRASIYHVDGEGRTRYYEAFVDGYNSTDWCFFGLHQWEYPISVGQMEKPLRDRLVSMDNPVVRELNSLCENGELRKSKIQKIVKPQDTRPEKGSFKGALGGRFGTLGLEFGRRTVETYGTVFLRDDLYEIVFVLFTAARARVVRGSHALLRKEGRSGDEYFIAPIRSPPRYWASPVDFEKALEQEYELDRWKKPLRERLVSMDNPVVRELNSLCEEGKLYAKNVSKEVGMGDLKPEEGFYQGSGYDTVAYFPVFNALVVAGYEGRPQGGGEVLILRQDEGRASGAGSPLRARRMDWENIINFNNKSMLKNWDTRM
ncbi:hypothetical protein FOZ61_003792 [Perkinsus olseni]|uniref:Uncharacterized protein n=1 Tax=Perkinsus olseni TaxID=32597 RepID=A0A7J6MD87_PEROL|nr:hypothetical protein FOZ61_003792 [Perkinsus olseni]